MRPHRLTSHDNDTSTLPHSLHFTSLHLKLHFTSLHFTSLHFICRRRRPRMSASSQHLLERASTSARSALWICTKRRLSKRGIHPPLVQPAHLVQPPAHNRHPSAAEGLAASCGLTGWAQCRAAAPLGWDRPRHRRMMGTELGPRSWDRLGPGVRSAHLCSLRAYGECAAGGEGERKAADGGGNAATQPRTQLPPGARRACTG